MGQTQSSDEHWWSEEDAEWEQAADRKLSHVGKAVYNKLRTAYPDTRHYMWNITSSKMIGSIQQTPPVEAFTENVNFTNTPNHSNFLVDGMFDLMVHSLDLLFCYYCCIYEPKINTQ